MRLYTDVDVFPSAIDEIEDSDAPNATNFNTFPEGLANRTRWLKNRLSALNATGTSMLTSLTGMSDLDTRVLDGYGVYVYRSASTAHVDGVWVINGNGGAGRWLNLEYKQPIMRLVQISTKQYRGSSFNLASETPTRYEPGGRVSGLAGISLLVSDAFDFELGDLVEVTWNVNVFLASGDNSDMVFGIDMHTGTVPGFIPVSCTDRRAQVTADLSHAGWNGGSLYQGGSNDCQWSISHTSSFTIGNTGTEPLSYFLGGSPCTINLVAGVDTEQHGQVLQGTSFEIKQFRLAPQ